MEGKIQLFKISKNTTIFLKGIAILLVLLGHLGYIYNGGSFGMGLFILLSGYGIFKSYLKNNNKNYFKNKF